MRAALIGLAGLALAGFVATAPAQAQGLPPGSYLQTCSDAHMEPGRLVASCRRVDGRWNRTALAEPYRCGGGIDNINGVLRCAGGGGPPGREFGGERERGGEFRERCAEWRRDAERLRYRLETADNPYERGRLEGRLHELRDRMERCRD